MENQSTYILNLSFLLLIPTIILSALQESNFGVYFSFYVISYLTTSLIYRPRRRIFDFVGVALLVIWVFALVYTVTFRVVQLP
jgi:hypothetical protein